MANYEATNFEELTKATEDIFKKGSGTIKYKEKIHTYFLVPHESLKWIKKVFYTGSDFFERDGMEFIGFWSVKSKKIYLPSMNIFGSAPHKDIFKDGELPDMLRQVIVYLGFKYPTLDFLKEKIDIADLKGKSRESITADIISGKELSPLSFLKFMKFSYEDMLTLAENKQGFVATFFENIFNKQDKNVYMAWGTYLKIKEQTKETKENLPEFMKNFVELRNSIKRKMGVKFDSSDITVVLEGQDSLISSGIRQQYTDFTIEGEDVTIKILPQIFFRNAFILDDNSIIFDIPYSAFIKPSPKHRYVNKNIRWLEKIDFKDIKKISFGRNVFYKKI